jgi:ArsR family transcriptional regulator, lead/cadmium/zinc/bismuth-responsive transcriptional repressor
MLPITGGAACDPAKPALAERPQLSPDQAAELQGLFKVLASDSRLRLLHALARAGELCVGDLAATVAMSPQAVSNQLQRLVDRRIVAFRRAGSNVYYRLVDPCVPGLLDLGLCLLEDAGRLPQAEPAQAEAGVGR